MRILWTVPTTAVASGTKLMPNAIEYGFFRTVVDTVLHHWPWTTIAAFLAVAVAVWATGSDIKERRLVLRQQAVIDVNTQSLVWISESTQFLAGLRGYLAGESSGNPLERGLPLFLEATTAMDKALQTARMVCRDFELRTFIAGAQVNMARLLDKVQAIPSASQEAAKRRECLQLLVDTGADDIHKFAESLNLVAVRGSDLYTVKLGPGGRGKLWLWERGMLKNVPVQPKD